MPIGNQPSVVGLNSQLGSCAVDLRNSCNNIIELWNYIVSIGSNETAQVAALVTLGFSGSGSPSDAQNFWTMANYLYSVNQLYYGQITQGTAFNYDSATAIIRGGN